MINGTYHCTDTGAATWSANPSSGGRGFCIVRGIPAVRDEGTTAQTDGQATTTAATTLRACG